MRYSIFLLFIALQLFCFQNCSNENNKTANTQDEFQGQLSNQVKRIKHSVSKTAQVYESIVIKDSTELFPFSQSDTEYINLQFSYKKSKHDTNKVITNIVQASNFCSIKDIDSNKDSLQIMITAFKGKSSKAVNQFARIYRESNLSIKEIEHSVFIENNNILYIVNYQGGIFESTQPFLQQDLSVAISILRDTIAK